MNLTKVIILTGIILSVGPAAAAFDSCARADTALTRDDAILWCFEHNRKSGYCRLMIGLCGCRFAYRECCPAESREKDARDDGPPIDSTSSKAAEAFEVDERCESNESYIPAPGTFCRRLKRS